MSGLHLTLLFLLFDLLRIPLELFAKKDAMTGKTIEEEEEAENCNKEFGWLDSPEYSKTRSCNGNITFYEGNLL